MKKERDINLAKAELEAEKAELLKQIREKDGQLANLRGAEKELYSDFFNLKNDPNFVLYKRFPEFKKIQAYYSTLPLKEHPINQYGQFDIKELAEVIKLLYSYQRQEEYQVLTFGFLDKRSVGFLVEELVPNMYFLIGNDKTLAKYREYQGCFLEEIRSPKFWNEERLNFIALKPGCKCIDYLPGSSLKCDVGETKTYYYDYINGGERYVTFYNDFNIFHQAVTDKFIYYRGIKDTLSFPIAMDDAFIAKVLISIAIYKKNHGKINLTNEDYRYIFHELYGEDVDIQAEIKRDIPKSLKNVPRIK